MAGIGHCLSAVGQDTDPFTYLPGVTDLGSVPVGWRAGRTHAFFAIEPRVRDLTTVEGRRVVLKKRQHQRGG